MFINTRKEAKTAARIAKQHGYDLSADRFYKEYLFNVFSPWANHQDARDAEADIRAEINVLRIPTQRDPAFDPDLEDRAYEISTRTGERYEIVFNRLIRGY